MYPCKKCGNCCRYIGYSEYYQWLDRGDGQCRYLEENLCSIYAIRPLLCRIEDSRYLYFADMSDEEYYYMNLDACSKLQVLK